ncbi:hypothetical protein ABPG74_022893 [Tetrahymena malaccensis]
MNFAYHQSITNLFQPSRLNFPNKNEKVLENLPVDDEREVDDETLQTQLESFLNYQEDEGKLELSKLHQGDYLFQFYMLKLEKRINIIRKTYEEGPWNGVESIKLIEKQDIGIIVILRNLISILETLVELFSERINALKIETDRFNNVVQLLLYCDNLEINYLVLKFIVFAESNQVLKTVDSCRLMESYYLYFINIWRQRYPYIAEIFKNEKFYKDTGAKPLGNDVQGDQAFYENPGKEVFKLEINSVKKEYSDFFSSYYQTQQLLAKDNVQQPPNKITPLFVNVMLTLRLAKNFSAIKNRALIAGIQCYSFVGGQRYITCIDALKKFHLNKDYRLLYAMKNFPYPDFQLDMLWCLVFIRDSQAQILNLEEDTNIEFENRFVDDFKAKYLNEDQTDFVENVKFDDVARYFEQFTGIYKSIKVDLLNKLGTKNSPHLAKLEQECNDLLDTLIKYYTLAINRLVREIKQAHDEDSINRSGNVLSLFRLFYVNSYFFEINSEFIGKEAVPIIEAVKELYLSVINFHEEAHNPELPFNALHYFRFVNHRLLATRGIFKNEIKEFITSKTFFDSCYKGFKSENQVGKIGAQIIFYHCDILSKVFLSNTDDERFQNTAEVVASYLQNNNLQLKAFSPANMVLNAFVKKYGDNLQMAQLVEKVNYSRFCFSHLRLDQSKEDPDQQEDERTVEENGEETSNKKNANNLLSSDIIDASFNRFTNKFVAYFNQYLDEKIPILQEDRAFETAVMERFPNFTRNAYVRSFVESLISTNALRASQFQSAFFQNFINILSKVPSFINEQDCLNLVRRSLDLVHYCSVDFKITLLYYLNIPQDSKLLIEENKEKIPMLHIFIQLFVELIDKNENTLTFLPYQGVNKNWILGQRNSLSIGDHASILISNYDAQNIASLTLVKQLCTLYGLFKTQTKQIIKDKVKLSNENLNAFIVKARKCLPELIATHIPQKVKYYVSKMDFNFEHNFIKTSQNPQVKKSVLTYLYSAFLYKGSEKQESNKYVISRTFMGDVDAFHSIKKGLEKYFVGLNQQLLKICWEQKENRLIIDDLSSSINQSILANVLTGQIRTDNIREAFQDLATNLVAEQEIRKSINYGSLNATFDQCDYYKKLSDLTNNILIVFRKFKINLEILKILKDDSSITRETWYKYQFLILSMVFIRWWFFVLQNKRSSVSITLDELLMGISPTSSLISQPEILKVLILDNKDKLKNSLAKDHCIQFFINSVNIRHFFLSNTYDGSYDLEFNNYAQLDGAPPAARQFIGQYLARLFGEISRTGIALISEEAKAIASTILYLQLKDERVQVAASCTYLQHIVIDLFKEYDPNFQPQLYPPTDLFISMKLNKAIDQLPDGMKVFVECLKKEIVNTPQVNRAPLIGSLVFVIIDIINKYEAWIIKFSTYNRANIVQFFIKMFEIYLDYLNISPQNLKHQIVNVSNMFKMLNIWFTQLSVYLRECSRVSETQIDNQVFVTLIKLSTQTLDRVIDYLEANLFKEYSKYSKVFSPYPILRNLLTFIAYSINKLKYVEINLDEQFAQLVKVLFRFSSVYYDDFIFERVNGSKNTNNLWTPLMRCFELMFTFQKENFIKTCIEIRIKNSIYISLEKRFKQYWSLKEIDNKKIIQKDMLENGRCLRQVIATLFEGLPEDQIEFKEDYEPEQELLPEIIRDADEPKEGEEEGQEKKEGEEDEEAAGDQPAAEEQQAQAAQEQENEEGEKVQENEDIVEKQEGEEDEEGEQQQQDAEEGEQSQQGQEQQDGEVEINIRQSQEGEDASRNEEQNSNNNQDNGENSEDFVDVDEQEDEIKSNQGNSAQENDSKKIQNNRKIRFKYYQNTAIQSSKVVKLNLLQKQIIDLLIDLIEARLNDSYNQSKEKQNSSETALFNIFYLEFPFAIKLLQMFMQKYPLTIPYILEKRIKIPEFSIFKKNNIISFLDFLIVGGSISEFTSNQILETLFKINYSYIEKKKAAEGEEEEEQEEPPQEQNEENEEGSPSSKPPIKKKPKAIPIIGSAEYYFNIVVERNITWIKKIIETKNFVNLESCFTILYGLISSLKSFFEDYSVYILTDQYKKILSILVHLIKRSANQQELFKLISIDVFGLMKECLQTLPKRLFKDRNIDVEFETALDYISYYINRNMLSYFEKEKGLELEKSSQFNYADVYGTINQNTKLINPEILQVRYQLSTVGPLNNNSSIYDKPDLKSQKDSTDVTKELLEEEKAFEGLFCKQGVIQSIDEMCYAHHEQFTHGLQALYDFYNAYPNLFAKKEHTQTFIYCLSHLYVVLRRQTEFEKQDYGLLETVYHHCPTKLSQFEILDEIIFKELNEENRRKQKEKEEQDRINKEQEKNKDKQEGDNHKPVSKSAEVPPQADRNPTNVQVNSANNQARPGPFQNLYNVQANPFAQNMNLLQNAIRQAQEAVQIFADRYSTSQRTTTGTTNSHSIQTTHGTTDTHISVFDFTSMGYPPNALELYKIDENAFLAANIDQKTELLREGKKKYQLLQKLQFVVEREKDILEKFMQKINAQIYDVEQDPHSLPKFNEDGSIQNHEELEEEEANGSASATGIKSGASKKKKIPHIPDTLKVYIQQNIIDFFNDLKPKEQRVQALSWDQELVEQMPQPIQTKIQNIREELNNKFKQFEVKKDVVKDNSMENENEEIQDLEEDINSDKIEDNLLYATMEKNASVDRVLKHQNLLLEMVPTFDDEFLLKLFESLHIFTDKNKLYSHKSVVELLGIVCQNPYNAYRIVDLISFLLFLYPRRSKITNESLNQNNLMQLIEIPILLLDKQISYRAEIDVKYWKCANYISVLHELLVYNQCHVLYGLQDYPINSLEEYKIQVGRSESHSKLQTVAVQFRPFDHLKDVKLGNLIKGQKDGIPLNQLVSFAQKWIAQDKNLYNNVLVYSYSESSYQLITEPFDKFNQIFYQQIQYNGQVKANYDNKYPVLYRPWKELNMEELMESFTQEIPNDLAKKKRISESSSFTLLQDKCKIFTIYLDFVKQYMRIAIKKLHPELKRLQAAFIHKRTQIKQNRGFEDLNDEGATLNDILDYNDFLNKFKNFLQSDMEVFKKSIKDLTVFFKIAQKEELKQILDEYKLRLSEDGPEAAVEWFKEEKNKISLRMIQDVRQVLLVEDPSVMSFFIDLLQFMIQSINYAWSLGDFIIPSYSFFDYPLKCILTLYDFLYPDEKKKKLNPAEEFGGDDIPDDSLPQLSKLITKPPEDMMDSIGLGQSMTRTMTALMSATSSKQFSGVDMTQLYDLILRELNKLIQYLINSYDVKSKKKWVEISNIIAVDVKSSRRLDAEKKMAKAATFAKFIAKKKTKGAERKIYINCQRDQCWQSSLGDLMNYPANVFVIQKFDVIFEGESGIDQGGLSREWIVLALNDILDPQKGLFKLSSNGVTMQPNPHSFLVPNHLTHFRFAGRLIAKGLIEKLDFEVDFTKSFLKHILHKTLYISDLEDIDPDEANNLLWILDNDVTDLCLTHSIDRVVLGQNYTLDLIPNGRNIEVTEQNKKEYVKQIAHFKMTEEIKEQIQSFLKGFYEILPQRSLKYMNEQELGLLLSGVKKIDVDDMKKHMRYYRYNKDSQIIQWFFEVMNEYDEDQRSLFLFFVTGSFKVPFGGFKNLQLEIAKIENKNNLPVAHTCTKSLDLPEYDSKEILKEKLTIAIQEGKQGFHIA